MLVDIRTGRGFCNRRPCAIQAVAVIKIDVSESSLLLEPFRQAISKCMSLRAYLHGCVSIWRGAHPQTQVGPTIALQISVPTPRYT